tara:strand:+ start:2549 stop:3367 length:819 start_codon:yes stop_codon:yes gene_type:complete
MKTETIFPGAFERLDENDSVLFQLDKQKGVAVILINRPSQLNALNKDVICGISEVLDIINNERKIKCILISGSGERAFVAGADIKEFKDFNSGDAFNLSKFGKEKLFNKITNYPKPIIAVISGYALGGGLELALACHLRVATDSSKLGLPECSLGLIPGYSGTQKLTKIVGPNVALEMILTSKTISSDEALKLGIINYSVKKDKLLSEVLNLAGLCASTSPESAAAAIKSVNASYLKNGDEIESEEFSKLFDTKNFNEGIRAFLDKRKPNFN